MERLVLKSRFLAGQDELAATNRTVAVDWEPLFRSPFGARVTREAVSRSDSLTGSYNGTRGDEHGTIGYELRFFR